MKSALVRASSAILVLIGCLTTAAVFVFVSPAARAQMGMDCPASGPCATPTPIPTPIPVNAFVSLDITAGGSNQQIIVSGSSFLPGEAMSIYWDTPGKVIGSATADGNGTFSGVKVKPFAGDPPGLHHICASVNPFPCAQFELQGTPTPTPSAPASPSPSPSPEASPSPTESPTPTPLVLPSAADTNNLDVLFHPPFIFLPFIAALGVVGAIAYWIFGTVSRRPRVLPSASIVHRSVRPEPGVPGIDLVPPPPAAPAADLPPLDVQPPWPAPNPPIEDPPESDLPRD